MPDDAGRLSLGEAYGLARSLLLYYGIPGRGERWRKFYCHLLLPGDLCFDVGAHVGNRTRALANTSARVIAVEPLPIFARLLRRLYGRRQTIEIVEKAVGARAGTARMLVSGRTPTVSSLSGEWVEMVKQRPGFARVRWEREAEVAVTTLDALIQEYGKPAFIKLDVEGYELEALKGLSTPVRMLAFEYIPAAVAVAQGCIERLGELGDYEFALLEGESPPRQLKGWMGAKDVKAKLGAMNVDGRSGEVFARLA